MCVRYKNLRSLIILTANNTQHIHIAKDPEPYVNCDSKGHLFINVILPQHNLDVIFNKVIGVQQGE